MEKIVDQFNNPIEIDDEITYVTVNGHTPKFQKGIVLEIDKMRYYNDFVKIQGHENKRFGWTYPNRIIVMKYLQKDLVFEDLINQAKEMFEELGGFIEDPFSTNAYDARIVPHMFAAIFAWRKLKCDNKNSRNV